MKDQNYINLLVRKLEIRDRKISGKKEFEEMKAELGGVEQEIVKYLQDHPGLKNYREENSTEARLRYTRESIKEYFRDLPPFSGDPSKIPDIPVLPVEFLRGYVWPGLYRAGAIRKRDLKAGKEYLGSCRNSTKATWDGEKFIYIRHKFGFTFEDDVPHFEDDRGTDVFIPIKEL